MNIVNTDFMSMVKPYLVPLRNTSLRMTKNEHDAQDLIQETMMKAYKAMHQFQKDTNFKAWVFRILVNTYITDYRKKSRQPQRVNYEDIQDYYPSSPLEAIAPDEGRVKAPSIEYHFDDDVKLAMEDLPAQFRVVVMLCDIEGFSYKEISDIMDAPLGTIMSRLFRGRKLLERSLWAYAKEKGLVVGEYTNIKH